MSTIVETRPEGQNYRPTSCPPWCSHSAAHGLKDRRTGEVRRLHLSPETTAAGFSFQLEQWEIERASGTLVVEAVTVCICEAGSDRLVARTPWDAARAALVVLLAGCWTGGAR